jgi:uncharacterized membrane protein YfcA
MDQLIASLPLILACSGAFLIGGVVKGVISIGLPLVGLPFLTMVVDVPTAVSLLLIPIFVSNLVQAIEGPGTLALLRRFWLLIVCLAVGTYIGSAMLTRLDQKQLLLVVGTSAVASSIATLLNPNLAIPPRAERWLAAPVGLAAGVIGGMSTLFGLVLAVYVIGLKLPRDLFVKCISLLYTIAAFYIVVGAVSHGATGPVALLLSALSMIPVYAGMLIGRRIRDRTQPEMFRRLVLGTVLLTGANMVRQGLGW